MFWPKDLPEFFKHIAASRHFYGDLVKEPGNSA